MARRARRRGAATAAPGGRLRPPAFRALVVLSASVGRAEDAQEPRTWWGAKELPRQWRPTEPESDAVEVPDEITRDENVEPVSLKQAIATESPDDILRNQALEALVALIHDLEAARRAGRSDAQLKTARELQRRAQFYVDFVEAENSTGFHAPLEAARILGEAMNYARQGQVAVRDPAFSGR